MEKKLKKSNQILKISQRVMLATIASSIVMAPTFSASASTSTNNKSAVAVGTQNTTKATSTTSAAVSISALSASAALNSTVSILDSEGWLESANVEWSSVSNATGYDVYYKSASASDSTYKLLDNQSIRKYSSYYRADVLGLAEGNYVIKIVPIISSKEDTSVQAITKTLSVKANIREGFAFSSASPMGTGSGGYKDDGTVASNATIVYITADTVNTIKSDVVTNVKGTKTTCTGLANILAARQKGYDKTPLIIRMVGEIKSSDITGLNSTGYLEVKGCYNVTLEGVGEDATAYGWGILVRNAHNVEIRNLGVMLFPDDGISLDTGNQNIWVHNNDIFYGAAGHDADQIKGDGSCDVKLSDYVTVSYNRFHDSGKCSLCGMSDVNNFNVTYHHNWFDHSDSRHPRIRVGTVHVYNNYFDGNAKYGVGVTKGSSAFVEANYFRNCKDPMLSSLQGTDIYNGSIGGFSKEPGGMIKAYNNKVEGAARLVYASENPTQFDAYLATSKNEVVPSTYKTVSGGTTYNNFDTKPEMYKYTPDASEDVESKVTTYAGRVNGGDLIWNFTNADDTNSTMDVNLMAKLKSYESSLVSVGGK
ncbi:pectate lyase [Clostridium gelidum]|uniref:Pectate lyase n=1 Tax=Clostridium gelidum TaxID=704125 RepID=A0ABM7T9P4_9CLOT|nr:right-handed parallel beta-helix repeat-containing protein [Clostridium gelidum]BCZ45680.1 pectate lyase [Clostridium gelidum]